MTQFMATVSAMSSCFVASRAGAPDRSVSHRGMGVPGGVKMSCPGLSVVTGQVHVEAVGSVVETVQGAFRQLTSCACPFSHVWEVRGNWAYEKFDIPLDARRSGASPVMNGQLLMDSPLWTTLHAQVTEPLAAL